MKSAVLAISLCSFAVTLVRAHGYVNWALINNVNYTGYQPYTDPYYSPPPERIIRAVPGNGPITDMSLIDVQCNGYSAGGVIGSKPAPLYATVTAGSQITLQWTEWPDSHYGPVITYMAKVPSGSDVTSWLPGTSPVWFKIDQAGMDYTSGLWATIQLIANGSQYKFTVPSGLANGQYIIRHELIALHSSYTYPGAQVYPSCIQVQVTGGGSTTPSGSNLVAFPGAYSGDTAGLVFPDWNPNNLQNHVNYPIPGPPLYFGGSYFGQPSGTTATTTTKVATTTTTTTTKAAATTTTTKAATTTTTRGAATTTTKAAATTTKATTTTASIAIQTQYGQCGGSGYTGPTKCASPYTCTASSAYYSQCL